MERPLQGRLGQCPHHARSQKYEFKEQRNESQKVSSGIQGQLLQGDSQWVGS